SSWEPPACAARAGEGGRPEMVEIGREAIGDVDARRDLCQTGQRDSEFHLRLGLDEAANGGDSELALRVGKIARRLDRFPARQQLESAGGSAEGPAHVEAIAGVRTAPLQRERLHPAGSGDGEDELLGPGTVAAD